MEEISMHNPYGHPCYQEYWELLFALSLFIEWVLLIFPKLNSLLSANLEKKIE